MSQIFTGDNYLNIGHTQHTVDTITIDDNTISNNSSHYGITISPWGTGTTHIPTPNVFRGSVGHVVLKLSEPKMPKKVYLCGRLLTVGVLGSDVECAFTGDSLMFEAGLLNALCINERITISLEYKEKICHYSASNFKNNTNVLDAQLVSTINNE